MRGVNNDYNFDDYSSRLATRRTTRGPLRTEQSREQLADPHFVHYDNNEGDCYHPGEFNLQYHLPPLVQLPFDQFSSSSNQLQLPTITTRAVCPRTTSNNEYYLVVNKNENAKYKVGQVSPKGIASSIDAPCDKRKRRTGEFSCVMYEESFASLSFFFF